jgi:hypothetical protein
MLANVTHALNTAIELGLMSVPCFPCTASKQPACPHGFHDAETGATALRELWSRFPGELVGVSTGESSGLDVLAIDPKDNEAAEWCKANQERFPNTRTHKTKFGGMHLIFRHAHGLQSVDQIVPGIDIRANGGYFIWWPAVGLPVLRPAPLADWPQWLLDDLNALSQTHLPPPHRRA